MDIVKKHIKEFIYNNQSSKDFFIKIKQNGVKISGAELDLEEVKIPGGNILYKNNGKNTNIKIEIDCYIDSRNTGENVCEVSRNIKKWLQKDISYKKLYFSDEDDFYYEAICFNKLDIQELLTKLGECKITFICKSKKVKSGDVFINISNNFKLYNKYSKSRPLIRLKGNGDITININHQKIILKAIEDEIEIDNNIFNAYKYVDGKIVNQNNKMYSNFILIEEGINLISYTGDVKELSIMPRWEADD